MAGQDWHRRRQLLLAEIRLAGRWLRHGFKFLYRIRKIGILLGVIAIGSYFLSDALDKHHQYTAVYQQLYPYYYKEYRKTLSEHRAKHYADFYAGYYAKYYSSRQYKTALKFSLPPPTKQAFRYPKAAPNADLAINDLGIRMLKHFEGFRAQAYVDIAGKLTIGYGHQVRRGEVFVSISRSNAEKLLRQDVKLAEAVIKRNVKVPLSQEQFSALVSLVYNIGSGNFVSSTLLRHLNAGEMEKAANEFMRWDRVGTRRAKGLTDRRRFERRLFLS